MVPVPPLPTNIYPMVPVPPLPTNIYPTVPVPPLPTPSQSENSLYEEHDGNNIKIYENKTEVVGLDLMFIDSEVFLLCVGRDHGVVHVFPIEGREHKYIRKGIDQLEEIHKKQHVNIIQYESDNEGGIKSSNIYIDRMISATHVAYVEIVVRVIKERVMCTRLGLLFTVDGDLLKHLVTNVALWMNLLLRAILIQHLFNTS